MFEGVSGKLGALGAKFPVVNTLMNAIRRHKNRVRSCCEMPNAAVFTRGQAPVGAHALLRAICRRKPGRASIGASAVLGLDAGGQFPFTVGARTRLSAIHRRKNRVRFCLSTFQPLLGMLPRHVASSMAGPLLWQHACMQASKHAMQACDARPGVVVGAVVVGRHPSWPALVLMSWPPPSLPTLIHPLEQDNVILAAVVAACTLFILIYW